MNIEINDNSLIKVLTENVSKIAEKEVNKLLSVDKLNQMANERFNKIFMRECQRIIADGRFYNTLSKHVARQLSDKIADEIAPKINLDEITNRVVETLTEKLVIKLNNNTK